MSWLRIPPGVHWLDVGCGTGALANAICTHGAPASVIGWDTAEPFIEFAREHCRDVLVSFIVGAVGDLPRRHEGYGSVTSLLALNFFSDPGAAVHEMRALTAPEGTVSACAWDYRGRMEFLRHFWDAATALDSMAQELDEGTRFPLCHPKALTGLFHGSGLCDVRCEPVEIPTAFAGFDDYWQPLLGGTGPAPLIRGIAGG